MMFERFTKEARAVVVAAESEAALMHAVEIGPEHLLIALSDHLADLGVDREELRRDAGSDDGIDADALATLGIDLDEVRRQAEEAFGEGALDRPPTGGRPRFNRAAKKVLELTLREAIALGHRQLGPGHVLLALTRDNRALALLARQGVTREQLRTAVMDGFGAPSG
jgi:ATP-dependent Clp protease ATP-binding subunit ClpA